jgi:hypothetical protein
MSDVELIDRGDGRFSATLLHSPKYPAITLYLRFPESGKVTIHDIQFHVVH